MATKRFIHMRPAASAFALALLGSAAAFPAMAQTTDSTVQDVEVLATVQKGVNLKVESTAGSRLSLTPLDTPASVSIITGDVIRNLGITSIIQAKTLAPGITQSSGPGNGGNALAARGFYGINSVKQTYNGLEIYNGGGVVSFPFDPWSVERVETLYGPASVLYGTGAIGGAVNVVSKTPDPNTYRAQAEASYASFNTAHMAFDFTGPIGAGFSIRLMGSVYRSDGWIDRGDNDSVAYSAALRWDATPNLNFILANDYGSQHPMPYIGTPTLNNRPVGGLKRQNYNVADQKLWFMDNWTHFDTEWKASDTISFHNSSYIMLHDRTYRDVQNFAYNAAARTVTRTTFRDIDKSYEHQYGSTGYFKFDNTFGDLKNELLVGADLNYNSYHRHDTTRGGTFTTPALNFTSPAYLDAYKIQSTPVYNSNTRQNGFYVEDRLALTEQLSIVAGARQDHYKVELFTFATNRQTNSSYDAFGGNVGVVYKPIPSLSVYVQAAKATDPVSSLPSIASGVQAFDVSPGRQYEAGLKQSLWDSKFEWTLAVYDLSKKKLLTPTLADRTIMEQVGGQSSKGVEASVGLTLGKVRLDVNGTVLDPKFDDFKATVGTTVRQLAGYTPATVPKKAANARVSWDITPQIQARAVVQYVGKRFIDNLNTLTLPEYNTVNLGLRWAVTPNVRIDARVDNATDVVYGVQGAATQWLLGAPRSYALSVNWAY